MHFTVRECLGIVEIPGKGRGRLQLIHDSNTYCESREYCTLQQQRETGLPLYLSNELHNPYAAEFRERYERTRKSIKD